MEPRLNEEELFAILTQWNRFLKRKVRLIACGGTAMTLLGVKPSTRDVDFMAPDLEEHDYLTRVIKGLGYERVTQAGWQRPGELFRFDIFPGNRIHTTGLLESPLGEGNHLTLKEYSKLYIGILNDYDLISSKLMRGTKVDFEDCIMLAQAHSETLNIDKLVGRFKEMILYDISEKRIENNINIFVELLHGRGML